MSTVHDPSHKIISNGNTTQNIVNTWLEINALDDVSIQINHKAGTGTYKIGVSNEYDPRFNPNPTPIDYSGRCTVTGGTLAVSAPANLMVECPYPCSFRAICVSYTFTSGGSATAGVDVTINAKG